MRGIFGNLFDFNNDGKLDAFEQAAELSLFHQIISDENKVDEDSIINKFYHWRFYTEKREDGTVSYQIKLESNGFPYKLYKNTFIGLGKLNEQQTECVKCVCDRINEENVVNYENKVCKEDEIIKLIVEEH